MIEPSRVPGVSRSSEPPQLLAELVCKVSRAPVAELSQLLLRIVVGVREIAGLRRGVITLLDYVSDQAYSAAEAGEPWVHPISSETVSSEQIEMVKLPLAIASEQLGVLQIISNSKEISLTPEQRVTLESIASMAAITLDRSRAELDRSHRQDWQDALSDVFAASRNATVSGDVDYLLQVIADKARECAEADFVILYEYFEEIGDVRLPPVISGPVHELGVLQGRSVAFEHKQSVIFRSLDLQEPLFAEEAPRAWIEKGLVGPAAQNDPRSFFHREDVVSSAGVPLRIEKERVGVLFINYRHERTFNRELRRHLHLFASQAALAIAHTRFFLRSDRYSQNLKVLNDIGRELGSAVSRDIEQIGQLIHDLTQRVIPTPNFFLCLHDVGRESYELPYIRDEYDTREALAPFLRDGLTGYVCRTAQPLLATPERKKVLFSSGEAHPVGRPSAIWLGAPLIVQDRVVGAIVIQDYEDETAFGEEHLQLFTAIASQAAIAIENSSLLRERTLQLNELQALLNLSQAFGTGKLTSSELLSSILDQMCQLARCDGSLLLLVEPGEPLSLKIAAASKGLEPYVNKGIGPGEGVAGIVIETKRPFIKENYRDWPKRSTLFDPPPEHVCAVPLLWSDAVIGVLTLSSDRRQRPFSDREIEILQRFAGPAAIAIQNSRDSSFRQALIHGGPYAIVAVGREGQITELNEEAASLFGFRKEEVLGHPVRKLHGGTEQDAEKIKDLLLSQDQVEEEEVFGLNAAGEKIPLSLTASLLREENGDIMGGVAVVEDLRIQSLRGRTSLLVDALREISAGDDLEAITRRVVGSALGLLYADAGCLFLSDDDSFTVAASHGHDEILLHALREGRAHERLREMTESDPKHILFFEEQDIGDLRLLSDARSCVLVPIRTETKLLGFLLIESRASRHFSADQELLLVLASQAAVSINRVQLLEYRDRVRKGLLVSTNAIAVGQIATTFLHEAKNSLSSISLTVQSVNEDIESEPDLGNKKDYLDRLAAVQEEVARFDALSRRLQRFTQQGLKPEKKAVYLNDVVRQTLILSGSAIRSKGIKLEKKLDVSLDNPGTGRGRGNPVIVDEDQIQQALMNLVLNAVAASANRRPLAVETRNLAEHLEIRVTDNGLGIPSEVRGNLFKPFFTTKKDGVGLGLFISQILVEENHGGSIEIVSSYPGKGSTFAIRLPKERS